MARGGPTGIVGPGNSGGAVTQLIIQGSPLFIRVLSQISFRVGLCSHTVLTLQDAWRHDKRWIRSALIARRRSRGLESRRS